MNTSSEPERRLTREDLQAILTRLRAGLEEIYGRRLVRMVLYGSQARGDAVGGSDIDVLIVLEGAVDPGREIEQTGEFAAAISLENNVMISRFFVSADRFQNEQSPLLINVRREGVPV